MTQGFLSTYLTPFLNSFYTHLDASINTVETSFNHYAAMVDFPAFCLVYAIVLIWLLRRLNRRPIFRPQNRELVGTCASKQIGKHE
jgi:flagellar biogenesis protein FliO